MTVRQLLTSIDSRELSEWYILADLEFWQKRLAAKAYDGPATVDQLVNTVFAKAKKQGGLTWQKANEN